MQRDRQRSLGLYATSGKGRPRCLGGCLEGCLPGMTPGAKRLQLRLQQGCSSRLHSFRREDCIMQGGMDPCGRGAGRQAKKNRPEGRLLSLSSRSALFSPLCRASIPFHDRAGCRAHSRLCPSFSLLEQNSQEYRLQSRDMRLRRAEPTSPERFQFAPRRLGVDRANFLTIRYRAFVPRLSLLYI